MANTQHDRTPAAGRVTSRIGLTALALAIAGPLLAHFEVVRPFTGFLMLALGLLLALVSVVAGLISLARGGGGRAARAMVPGALIVAAVAFIVLGGGGGDHPRINDITTDTATPPQFVQAPALPENAGRDMSYPGPEFATQQQAGYPDLGPLRIAAPPDQVFPRVAAAARNTEGWTITREDAVARAVEGLETSRLFRFRDDFVIEVRPDGSGSVVHMRSKSRDGQGDMGVNAARIKSFLARVQ